MTQSKTGPRSETGADPMRIAIVGSGISGMSAAWLLSRRHHVTVFEKDERLGGHSHTILVDLAGKPTPVDCGFIVYNDATYPNLSALFRHLDVPTVTSDMSFSVSVDGGHLEYSGTDLAGLFGQPRNVLRPRLWSMIRDLLRFYRQAPRDLRSGRLEGLTLGGYLANEGYARPFIEDHLLPMAAAIWSSPLHAMLEHSAASFVKFFENHGLLNIQDRPIWRSVAGGSREYVRRLTRAYSDRVRLKCAARRIARRQRGVWIEDETGAWQHFDHVVLATHADQALSLLEDASPLERRLLGAIRYQPNRAYVHRDSTMMPKRRRLWSSWNYARVSRAARSAESGVFVTYWMNRLQRIEADEDIFVTLNPTIEPRAATIVRQIDYSHPLMDAAAVAAQKGLWQIQGRGNVWYCGAYFGAGFHEDGLQAGLAVAEQLGGVRRPWRVEGESDRIAIAPSHLDAAE